MVYILRRSAAFSADVAVLLSNLVFHSVVQLSGANRRWLLVLGTMRATLDSSARTAPVSRGLGVVIANAQLASPGSLSARLDPLRAVGLVLEAASDSVLGLKAVCPLAASDPLALASLVEASLLATAATSHYLSLRRWNIDVRHSTRFLAVAESALCCSAVNAAHRLRDVRGTVVLRLADLTVLVADDLAAGGDLRVVRPQNLGHYLVHVLS